MKVVIVGAGLGGLAAAISCRKHGIDVLVLERAPNIEPIGAGVQVPPNATRIMKHLGLLEALGSKSDLMGSIQLRRYQTGEVLYTKPGSDHTRKVYGVPWYLCHRADYHKVLWDEAVRLGADIKLDAFAQKIDFEKTEVHLQDNSVHSGDVIIGADGEWDQSNFRSKLTFTGYTGLWSTTRDQILGHPSPPTETGDMAYRAIFDRQTLKGLNQPVLTEIINSEVGTAWMGPNGHVIMYPVRQGEQFNMVLIGPDILPEGVKTGVGTLEDVKKAYDGWDPAVLAAISCIKSVLKWKLLHHEELESWVKNHVAIIGDACHPTLPYQAQGAAMAVEDGTVVGYLLGQLNADFSAEGARSNIHSILCLYEKVRKSRTTVNVQGAVANRTLFHMIDGPEQEERDRDLRDPSTHNKWQFTDEEYQDSLLGFDVIEDTRKQYALWKSCQTG